MRQTLDETLQQLHDLLHNSHDLDQDQREKLRAMVDEIRQALNENSGEAESTGLGTRLVNAASQIEHSHPTITNTIGRIADLLAQMGI
jgi:predicted  nucleic acid-binding Zn-ribbon protein